MAGNAQYNINFGDTRAQDNSSVQVTGIRVNNYYQSEAKSVKQSLLNEFGPVDPRDVRARIIDRKDALLPGTCDWVFEEEAFQAWLHGKDGTNILWIQGQPGKGKTMIVEAILSQRFKLLDTNRDSVISAYYLCERADNRLNSAAAVLKGLIYMLVAQNQQIVQHLAESYHIRGNGSDSGLLFSQLWNTLKGILNAFPSTDFYFFIDALDECSTDMHRLLDNIIRLTGSLRLHWLLTSRHDMDIAERLDYHEPALQISLEANSDSVSRAVSHFINDKVQALSKHKRYDPSLTQEVRTHLESNSGGTFLWVSLVCKELSTINRAEVQTKLYYFPSRLKPLYEQMLSRIQDSREKERAALCLRILRFMVVSYRPQTVMSIGHICSLPNEYLQSSEDVSFLINQCGSFLMVREDQVYFVHQSALDFLTTFKGLLSNGLQEAHCEVSIASMRILRIYLKKDICGTQKPGAFRGEVSEHTISSCISSHLQYACLFWLQHLLEAGALYFPTAGLNDGGEVHKFLETYFLYWSEALCWLDSVSVSLVGLESLLNKIKNVPNSRLRRIVHDANRFLVEFRGIIETYPLQTYYSALVFCPSQSDLKVSHADLIPKWFLSTNRVLGNWDRALRILGDPGRSFQTLSFSPDGKFLAAASLDSISLWALNTGDMRVLRADAQDFVFSSDSRSIITWRSDGRSIGLWSFADEKAQYKILQGFDSDRARCSTISSDGRLASILYTDGTVNICHIESDQILLTFKLLDDLADPILISPDGKMVASSHDSTISETGYFESRVCIWNSSNGELQCCLPDTRICAVSIFSPNSCMILLQPLSGIGFILWDIICGKRIADFNEQSLANAVFSSDNRMCGIQMELTMYRKDLILIVDCTNGSQSTVPTLNFGYRKGLGFSQDSTLFAVSYSGIVALFDTQSRDVTRVIDCNCDYYPNFTFQNNGSLLAISEAAGIKLLDASEYTPKQGDDQSDEPSDNRILTSFPERRLIVTWSQTIGWGVRVWRMNNTGIFTPVTDLIYSVPIMSLKFVPKCELLVIQGRDNSIKLFETTHFETVGLLNSFTGKNRYAYIALKHSPDCNHLLFRGINPGQSDRFIVWNTQSRAVIFDGLYAADEEHERNNAFSELNLDKVVDLDYPSIDPFSVDRDRGKGRKDTYRWIYWKKEKLIVVPPSVGMYKYPTCALIDNTLICDGKHGFVQFSFDTKRLEQGEIFD